MAWRWAYKLLRSVDGVERPTALKRDSQDTEKRGLRARPPATASAASSPGDGLGRGANVRESLSPGELGRRGYHRSEAGSARRDYWRATLDASQRLLPGRRDTLPARLRRVRGNHDRRLARRRSQALDEVRRAKVLCVTEAVMA